MKRVDHKVYDLAYLTSHQKSYLPYKTYMILKLYIQEHHINARYTKYAEIIIDNFKEKLMVSPLTMSNDIKPVSLSNTWFKGTPRSHIADPEKIIITNPIRRDLDLGPKKQIQLSLLRGLILKTTTLKG